MDKFEDWYFGPRIERTAFERSSANYHMVKLGWIAGRESMRQDAMKVADDQWVKDPRISASDAIRKIEA